MDEEYGSRRKFLNACAGKVYFVKGTPNTHAGKGTSGKGSLESYFDAMYEQFPELLSEPDGSMPDEYHQPQALLRAWAAIQPTYNGLEGADIDELSVELATEMFNAWLEAPKMVTLADRENNKLAKVLADNDRNIEDIKAYWDKRYKDAIEKVNAVREAESGEYHAQVGETWTRAKASADKRVETQKRYFDERQKKTKEFHKKVEENNKKRGYRQIIEKEIKQVVSWLANPTKKASVPEFLRDIVISFFNSIDCYSEDGYTNKDIDWYRNVSVVLAKLSEARNNNGAVTDKDGNTVYIDIPPLLVESLENLLARADIKPLRELDLEGMRQLSIIVRLLKSTIIKINTLHANNMSDDVAEVSRGYISDTDKHVFYKDPEGDIRFGLKGIPGEVAPLADAVRYGLMDSFTYGKLLGKYGGSVIRSMQKGLNSEVRHLNTAVKFFAEEINKKYDIKEWKKQKISAVLGLNEDGSERVIDMTAAQAMNLYLLWRREQAQLHIRNGGFLLKHKNKQTGKAIRAEFTGEESEYELFKVFDQLSDEQRECADKLQKFLAHECGAWGNEITMKMYLFRGYGDENYWPITVNKDTTATTDVTENANPLRAAENQSFTNSLTPFAQNAIIVDDVFSVFAQHVSGMAIYNAYSMPISDAMKFINYKEFTEDGGGISVKDTMTRTIGQKGQQYFIQLLKDVQNVQQRSHSAGLYNKLVSMAKGSAISMNLRVVVQQPTAILRALTIIDPRYLVGSMPSADSMKLMKEYCPIALWKSWGFFETDVGNGLQPLLSGKSGMDKARDAGTWLAGFADNVTWATIWNACMREIGDSEQYKNTYKNISALKNSTNEADQAKLEEYYAAVGERMSEIIDETQVVDSVFHRAMGMRSKDGGVKVKFSFMTEPLKSLNCYMRAYISGDKGRIVRTAVVWALTQTVNSAAQALVDAFRDDDEEKKWIEKWLEAFKDNLWDNLLNPFNMFPYAKDLISAIKGYSSGSLSSGFFDSIAELYQVTKDMIDEKEVSPYSVVYAAATVASYPLNIGVQNAVRSFKNIYNAFADKSIGYSYKKREQYMKMYEALEKGDGERFEKWCCELTDKGYSRDDILSGFTGYFMSHEPLVWKAGDARDDSDFDTYESSLSQIVSKLSGVLSPKEAYVVAVDAVKKWQDSALSGCKTLAELEHNGQADSDKYSKKHDELLALGLTDAEIRERIDSFKDEDFEESEKEPQLKYASKDIVNALKNGNTEDAQKVINFLLENGKNNSSVKSSITSEFKDDYLAAFENGDKSGMNEVSELLLKLKGGDEPLYDEDNLTDWIKDEYKEAYYKAYRDGNTAETQRIIKLLNALDVEVKDKIMNSWLKYYNKWLEKNP